MTLFLVDSSVIQRLAKPSVRTAWDRLSERGEIATYLPSLLEAGHSARSASDYERPIDLESRAKVLLPPQPGIVEVALLIQSALFAAGIGRTVGVSDLQIAATALHHSSPARPVVVAHDDADLDDVASVEPGFRSRWIAPRPTAD